MRISINENKIFILGAGASKEYNLPTWAELTLLIKDNLSKKETANFKKEILEWLSLVDTKYETIDKCISEESKSKKYKENGQDIEFEIFRNLEEIFIKLSSKNEEWWISFLNERIKKQQGIDFGDIFFINYNYDSILSDNFLNFDYLSQKQRNWVDRERIETIRKIIFQHPTYKVKSLYPHWKFKKDRRWFLNEMIDTINAHDPGIPQTISCYDSHTHMIELGDPETSLYILGLGWWLKVNLKENIIFENSSYISNIYITVRREKNIPEKDYQKRKNEVVDFLFSHYGIKKEKIYVFNDCKELIENCFPDN